MQRTRVRYPAPKSGSSQPPTTPAPGEPLPSSDCHRHAHIPVHKYVQTCTYAYIHINKKRKDSLGEVVGGRNLKNKRRIQEKMGEDRGGRKNMAEDFESKNLAKGIEATTMHPSPASSALGAQLRP